jgi:hypothetical protein
MANKSWILLVEARLEVAGCLLLLLLIATSDDAFIPAAAATLCVPSRQYQPWGLGRHHHHSLVRTTPWIWELRAGGVGTPPSASLEEDDDDDDDEDAPDDKNDSEESATGTVSVNNKDSAYIDKDEEDRADDDDNDNKEEEFAVDEESSDASATVHKTDEKDDAEFEPGAVDGDKLKEEDVGEDEEEKAVKSNEEDAEDGEDEEDELDIDKRDVPLTKREPSRSSTITATAATPTTFTDSLSRWIGQAWNGLVGTLTPPTATTTTRTKRTVADPDIHRITPELSRRHRTTLAQLYDVPYTEHSDNNVTTHLFGSFAMALERAQHEARFMVVLLLPAHFEKMPPEARTVMQSFLSNTVARVAQEPPPSRGTTASTGSSDNSWSSFFLWTASFGSGDATAVLSRVKGVDVSHVKAKRPMLLVLYPAPSLQPNGKLRALPKLVAQHHCRPPLSAKKMATWLKKLRRRNYKIYAKLQHLVRESQQAQERVSNYQGSVVADQTKKQRQEQERLEKQNRERAQQQHMEKVQQRRVQLLAALPDEPPATTTSAVTTVALRFVSKGQTSQRRFDTSTTRLVDIFNWIDAVFELEREHIVLQTMNGQETYDWNTCQSSPDHSETLDDTAQSTTPTLLDMKWGKMVALRVRVAQVDAASAASSSGSAKTASNDKSD